MDCNEARPLLDAHLDEELDVVHDAAVAAHLETCAGCAALALELTEQRRQRQALLTRHRAPPELTASIRAAWREAEDAMPPKSRGWPRGANRWLALAASVAVAASAGYYFGGQHAQRTALLGELTAAHVRARLTGHLIDVASSDQHTVKPWFAGKVDFAPQVPDLAAQGFPLVGGRLERLAGRTVATLVYGRRRHTIDLQVWAGPPAPLSGAFSADGYSIRGWSAGGLNFAAVSDVAPEDLAAFAELVRGAAR
ncbi:MAG: anti-sigma factor [Opitutae bacterium]|nr:anti-sigma factor [Opitutae bacterium]